MTTKRESKRILSVTIRREVDTDPDTSWLGEFSTRAKDYAIAHVGEYAGQFVDQLPCECAHEEDKHTKREEGETVAGEGACSVDGCDCEEFDRAAVRGDSRLCEYFNPNAGNYEGEPDAEIRKYCLQDYERMRTLGDDWTFIGISARAEVQLTGDTTQTITSGGLWGIESDSGDYLKEVEGEQVEELKAELHAIGFSKRAIAAAFRKVEHKED